MSADILKDEITIRLDKIIKDEPGVGHIIREITRLVMLRRKVMKWINERDIDDDSKLYLRSAVDELGRSAIEDVYDEEFVSAAYVHADRIEQEMEDVKRKLQSTV